ncbi:MAG: aminomethyl-transferring glycine dehydrogenase subunit GcvPA [Gammaproteobacteria bacterium]|nr:aminomethyl-transferring glycine dehydrogenase subunit GcvPA [Gammaproteobacteria bacterium]MDH4314967.1 aminomethyl-transferring glycine dehydrogenase subunit GcvPA [Gammaproteobacteria bacterium]MDH5214375.1 aminomethyl-transferring glycine dehydrogenase subunit GcvPA [Gammaproteobacteria bacterium]
MPFIPHTDDDVKAMLETIGVDSIEQLFDEIPKELRIDELKGVPEALSEMEITRLMRARSRQDGVPLCFIGAGAYEHHIPTAVWDIATRGEFYSAYTPYQAEASQGTLQVIYEYQSMITALTGLDTSNASLYDGASALAEASLMAVRSNRTAKSSRILLAAGVNPTYEKVAAAISGSQGLHFERLPLDKKSGTTNLAALQGDRQQAVALVVQQPSFFGTLEPMDKLTDWAHANGALLIAVVNPTSLAILKAPGAWGKNGADIACGEGQPLGVPLSSGGPYFGFMACKQVLVRQMPGRIVGRTSDVDGKPGFTLTLQAREQHIRRTKATSNICTNQGLMVTGATIYMSLLGHQGIARVARSSQAATARLAGLLSQIDGVSLLFDGAHFHEIVIGLDRPVAPVLDALAAQGILGGFDLSTHYPELGNALLVCATETKTDADLEAYQAALGNILAKGKTRCSG